MSEQEEYKFIGTGLTTAEKDKATVQFATYRGNYHIESISDLNLLEELVLLEVYRIRYKKAIGKFTRNKKVMEKGLVPNHLNKALEDNLKQQLELRDKLGLFEDKKIHDPFAKFRMLLDKFKIWLSKNQGTRTISCPHCSKQIMLKIRTEAWEALKHPWFQDKFLANEYLWKLYKEGKITALDMAKVLLGKEVTSTDYVTWLEEKIFPRDK